MKRAVAMAGVLAALCSLCSAQSHPVLAVSSSSQDAVNLYQVDGAQLKLQKSVAAGKSPGRMCVDSAGATLYVVIANGVAAVDLHSATALATMTDAAIKSPFACVVSPDARKLYLTDRDANTVLVFALPSHQLLRTIRVPEDPRFGVFTPDHKQLIVSCGDAKALAVIDADSDAVLRTIKTVGLDPRAMAFTPDGQYLVVALVSSDVLSWFHAGTLEPVNSFGVTRSPQGLVISADGQRLYVTGAYEGVAGVVDLREKNHEGVGEWRETARIPIGAAYSLAISADGNYLYAPTTDGFITVVDLRSWKIQKPIALKGGGVLYLP